MKKKTNKLDDLSKVFTQLEEDKQESILETSKNLLSIQREDRETLLADAPPSMEAEKEGLT
jgi:hypothetical protein